MKILSILLIFILSSVSAVAQKAAITLRFSALLGSQYTQFDSVRVTNMTQGGDTILQWPDTTLVLHFTGVGIQEVGQQNPIELSSHQDAEGSFMLRIELSVDEKTDIVVYDAMGRQLAGMPIQSGRGVYETRFTPPGSGLYLVCCSTQHYSKCMKWIARKTGRVGSGGFVVRSYSYSDEKPRITLNSAFPFIPGDSMEYIAYLLGSQIIIKDKPIVNNNYTFQFPVISCSAMAQFVYGGHLYHAVQIGSQCWMKENLNIGTMVSSVYLSTTPHSECSDNGIIEKYCYLNDPDNCVIYGGLYDWNELMQYSTTPGIQGICPSGWHIPTDSEWCILTTYLDSTVNCNAMGWTGTNAGGKMKESGMTHWDNPNLGATNQSGFSALGAGVRYDTGYFGTILSNAHFYSSSESSEGGGALHLFYNYATIAFGGFNKLYGVSVRCIKE